MNEKFGFLSNFRGMPQVNVKSECKTVNKVGSEMFESNVSMIIQYLCREYAHRNTTAWGAHRQPADKRQSSCFDRRRFRSGR